MRRISLSTQSYVLFRGLFLQLFCVGLAGVSALYWFGIIPKIDFSTFYFRGEKQETQAVILDVRDTGWREDGSQGIDDHHTGAAIYQVDYEFVDKEGKAWRGFSFGETMSFKLGQEVEVEYLVRDPAISHLKDMRFNVLEFVSFLSTVVPLGFGFVVFLLLTKSWKELRFLKNGRLILAELQSFSSEKVGDTTVEELTGKYSYLISENVEVISTYVTRTVLEECMLIVYDSQNPTSFERLRDLEKEGFGEEFFEVDEIKTFNKNAYFYALAPALVIVVSLFGILWQFLN